MSSTFRRKSWTGRGPTQDSQTPNTADRSCPVASRCRESIHLHSIIHSEATIFVCMYANLCYCWAARMEFLESSANRDECSPHPAFTYRELYEKYLTFIDLVNGPILNEGLQCRCPTPLSFEVFKKSIQKSRIREIVADVEFWETPRIRKITNTIKIQKLLNCCEFNDLSSYSDESLENHGDLMD